MSAYAKGIGCTRAGVIETTFKDETETDLLGEQWPCSAAASASWCAGYETLSRRATTRGSPTSSACTSLKLIVDLMYEKGITGMRYSVSNTAEYGDLTRGKRVIDDRARAAMREILAEIQSGDFAREWIAENKAGQENFLQRRREEQKASDRARGAARDDAVDRPGVLSRSVNDEERSSFLPPQPAGPEPELGGRPAPPHRSRRRRLRRPLPPPQPPTYGSRRAAISIPRRLAAGTHPSRRAAGSSRRPSSGATRSSASQTTTRRSPASSCRSSAAACC